MASIHSGNKRENEIIVYKSIDFLPTWNFYEGVLKTNDLRYLLKLNDYSELPEYKADLTDIWQHITEQVNSVSKSNDFSSFNSAKLTILKLRCKFDIFKNALLILTARFDDEEIQRIKTLGYAFDAENIENSILEAKGKLSALGKVIEYKQKQFEAQFKKDSNDSSFDLYTELANIEQYKKFSINPHVVPIRQFLVYQNELRNFVKIQDNGRRANK